jgi:hypothetical protein
LVAEAFDAGQGIHGWRSTCDAAQSRSSEQLCEGVGCTGARSHVMRGHLIQEAKMKLALIGLAALLTAATVTPALAQAVISDPGYCAQFYPNANCDNLGPGNPYTDGGYWRNDWKNGSHASAERPRLHHQRKHG